MRNHAIIPNFVIEQKKTIKPRTFGELHMNECRSFFITTNFLFHTCMGADLLFFSSFLPLRQTNFSMLSQFEEKKIVKKIILAPQVLYENIN